MSGFYQDQWQVPSSSNPNQQYTVSLTMAGEWQCSCRGWTTHVPRRDCKHITKIRGSKAVQLNGLNKPAPSTHAVLAPWTPSKVVPVSSGAILRGEVEPHVAAMNREEASLQARAKREAVDLKKKAKLGKLRFGFQLAHTYEPADLSHGKWVAEIKYDGELGMLIDGRLINRSGNDITDRFPEIEKRDDAVLVGEVVILDANGKSEFNKIQERATDDPIRIMAAARMKPAVFMAFDILEHGGVDVAKETFAMRRKRLELYFQEHGWLVGVKMVDQIPVSTDKEVQTLVNTCRDLQTEGLMLKNLSATYVAVRGRNWVKAKTWQEKEFDVVRFEDTGVGDGFVIYVMSKKHEQRVACNSIQMRDKIRKGHKRVEIKFLSEAEDGALRFPSLRRLM